VRRNRSSIRDIVTSYVALLRTVNVGGKTLAMSAVATSRSRLGSALLAHRGRATTVVKEASSRSEGAPLVFEFQERADVARLMKKLKG
jgi:hypothetical protein